MTTPPVFAQHLTPAQLTAVSEYLREKLEALDPDFGRLVADSMLRRTDFDESGKLVGWGELGNDGNDPDPDEPYLSATTIIEAALRGLAGESIPAQAAIDHPAVQAAAADIVAADPKIDSMDTFNGGVYRWLLDESPFWDGAPEKHSHSFEALEALRADDAFAKAVVAAIWGVTFLTYTAPDGTRYTLGNEHAWGDILEFGAPFTLSEAYCQTMANIAGPQLEQAQQSAQIAQAPSDAEIPEMLRSIAQAPELSANDNNETKTDLRP